MSEPQAKNALQAVIDMFWKDNPELQKTILQDVYCLGRVRESTSEAAMVAVYKWIGRSVTNGDQK
jgi:hypothetical protein